MTLPLARMSKCLLCCSFSVMGSTRLGANHGGAHPQLRALQGPQIAATYSDETKRLDGLVFALLQSRFARSETLA